MWEDVWNGERKGTSTDTTHIIIEPGTSRLIHILLADDEQPISYWTHYVGNRTVICPGRDICPACRSGKYKSTKKHSANVWDYDTQSVKILEQGNDVWGQLKLIKDQLGTLDGVDMSIKRIGAKRETRYVVVSIPRTQPFNKQVVINELDFFDIDILKSPTNVERIQELMNRPSLEPQTQQQPLSQLPKIDTTRSREDVPLVLQFGKYKGKTFEEIATIDMNYVKWCAENLSDVNSRAHAKKVVDAHKIQPQPSMQELAEQPQPTEQQDREVEIKKNWITQITSIINSDKYSGSGQYQLVVDKMRKATISNTSPNGKTLLEEYTLEELGRLLASLQE